MRCIRDIRGPCWLLLRVVVLSAKGQAEHPSDLTFSVRDSRCLHGTMGRSRTQKGAIAHAACRRMAGEPVGRSVSLPAVQIRGSEVFQIPSPANGVESAPVAIAAIERRAILLLLF